MQWCMDDLETLSSITLTGQQRPPFQQPCQGRHLKHADKHLGGMLMWVKMDFWTSLLLTSGLLDGWTSS